MKKITTGASVSTFTYDANGNRLTEGLVIGGVTHQSATVTWDAMNRMVSLVDAGTPGGNSITLPK